MRCFLSLAKWLADSQHGQERKQYLKMMTNMPIGHPFESASRLGRTAAPATPRPTCSRVGATFAQNVVTGVDIGVQDRSITCTVPTASYARAGERGFFRT